MTRASIHTRLRQYLASLLWPVAAQKMATPTERQGAGPAIETLAALPSNLLYARGFLLTTGEAPPTVQGWVRHPVGAWNLHVDPRVPVEHAASGDVQAWLVGDAYDPVDGVYRDIVRHLLDGDLLTNLDDLAGRFLLVVSRGDRIELYHDAMGSRSIFYGGGVAASHAALVSDVLGTGLREWIIPYITSRGYSNRDVKYLPGLDSSFQGVRQLTPNTRLVLPSCAVERYWPRGPLRSATRDQALDCLIQHVEGLRCYLETREIASIAGMSAGRDSRGLVAGLAPLRPRLFTFVRSKGGTSTESADSRAARQVAELCGLDLEIVKLAAPPHLDTAASGFAACFRRNTGYVRGNNSGWIEHFTGESDQDALFVRGFGGEVMRGFYSPIPEISPGALANTYDINAGSAYTRDVFLNFIGVAQWRVDTLHGYGLNDLFYWEHRMGTWGSSALSESDMAFRSIPGYNSRALFTTFMGVSPEVRRESEIFEEAIARMMPSLAEVPYES